MSFPSSSKARTSHNLNPFRRVHQEPPHSLLPVGREHLPLKATVGRVLRAVWVPLLVPAALAALAGRAQAHKLPRQPRHPVA